MGGFRQSHHKRFKRFEEDIQRTSHRVPLNEHPRPTKTLKPRRLLSELQVFN